MLDKRIVPLAASFFLLSTPVCADEADEADQALEGMGGVPCIDTGRILRTEIVDDRNILFYTRGRGVYRNELRRRCRALLREKRFSYRSSMGRLCDTDRIMVLVDYGSGLGSGTSCKLGKFFPLTEDELAALTGELDYESEPLPPSEPEEPETME